MRFINPAMPEGSVVVVCNIPISQASLEKQNELDLDRCTDRDFVIT
jgi:hypothetical protein